MTTSPESVQSPTFPSLRDSADRASSAAQKNFVNLNRLHLGLLVSVACIAGLSHASHEKINWAVCLLMITSLGLTTALRVGKFDDKWFRCRAFAENFKSTVWRFIMSPGDSSGANERRYLNEIEQLNGRIPELQRELTRFKSSGNMITGWMRNCSQLSITQKASLYRDLRLQDQIEWYANKAEANAKLETAWFWVVFSSEFIVVIMSALRALLSPRLDLVSGVASLCAAFIAWTQIKRFSDLGTSYAIAARDLQLIADESRVIGNQADLDLMVLAVETAVSREHSMWLARRIIAT